MLEGIAVGSTGQGSKKSHANISSGALITTVTDALRGAMRDCHCLLHEMARYQDAWGPHRKLHRQPTIVMHPTIYIPKKFLLTMESYLASRPILFRLEYFYHAVEVLPWLVVISGLVFYFLRGPSYGYIPSIGELMVGQPQERIFGVGMTIEAVFLLFFGLIRDHIIIFLFERASKINQKVCRVLLQFTRFLIVIACFAMIVCACVPVNYNATAHEAATVVFFLTLFGYFLFSDVLTWKMEQTVKVASVSLTAFGMLFAVVFAVLRFAVTPTSVKVMYGVASVFEYIAVFLLFIKLVVLKQEMPRHGIRLTKKLVYHAPEPKLE